ncbi:MAG: inorganic diphosphatase [Polyangiaceae bacterium]|nr:inorganic diphosphatase [Polyangiaceae bacterium]
MNLNKLPTFKRDGVVRCVVESPQGSTSKYKYEPEIEAFELSRPLPKGLTYPFDWGFIPSTLAADGDPVDVMIIHDAPSHPGLVVASKLIGVLEVLQQEGDDAPFRNDRVFAVPATSHREDEIGDVHDLPKRLRIELEAFFVAAAKLEDKKLQFLEWRGPAVAAQLVDDARKRLENKLP